MLYQVADISADEEYIPEDDFDEYSVCWESESSSSWKQLAETLASYAARDTIPADGAGKTDANGVLAIPIQAHALYLVVGSPCTVDGERYTSEPFLFALTDDTAGDSVTVSPKHSRDTSGPSTVSRSVVKVWKDSDTSSRPEQVEVQLLRNGAVYETVTLSEANNWRHHWSSLRESAVWQVTEKEVPDGYTVSIELENTTFVLTNTAEGLPADPGKEDSPDDPSKPADPNIMPDNPADPAAPDSPSGPETPDHLPDNAALEHQNNRPDMQGGQDVKLPQTGMCWWPVPLLACAGMLCFLLGWLRYKGTLP